jgi:hypothetical protein
MSGEEAAPLALVGGVLLMVGAQPEATATTRERARVLTVGLPEKGRGPR